MSSRLMPPNVGSSIRTALMIVVRVMRVQFDVEDVDVGEALEKHPFPFHDRLAGQRPDVAQAEHGGAVGNDCDKVSLRGVQVSVVRVRLDLPAWFGNTGGVGQRQVALRLAGFRRDHLDFPSPSLRMVIKCVLFADHNAFLAIVVERAGWCGGPGVSS